jgi:protein-S-isoprenylcysteine O-methyltransferase Ste14
MTRSASTPRLRATLAVYVALFACSLIAGPVQIAPLLDALLRTIGLVLIGIAVLGRIWCSTFIAGLKDAALVTSGPYALCRHPLYSLSMLGALGLAFASRSIALGGAAVLLVGVMLRSAAATEERFLAQRFPADWPSFAARTRRWWPRFANYQPPATTLVNVPVYWKAFVDAGAFLLLYILIDLAASSRIAGLTPLWLPLP